MKTTDTASQEWVRHTERMKALKRERLKLRKDGEALREAASRLPQVGWLDNPSEDQAANRKMRDANAAALLENEKQIMAESGYKF